MKIIECVPNFSEGIDRGKIDAIAAALTAVKGVRLLDVCIDADHNRTVLTFIGAPEDVEKGAVAVCERAIDLIDMREHRGVHPRIGAVDVVPFVPLKGATMKDAVDVAHRFGRIFGERNKIPVYFYGEAALDPARRELPDIRKGGYEGLKKHGLMIPCGFLMQDQPTSIQREVQRLSGQGSLSLPSTSILPQTICRRQK